jgi:hypothetical protein
MKRKSVEFVKFAASAMLAIALSNAVISSAHAGPAWGPPGWTNGPLDPSRPPAPRPARPVDPNTGMPG